jgi:two-component system, OmpR family, response regulator CpxR
MASGLLHGKDMDEPAPPRILVVDDDPVACAMMADVLGRAGYAVEWTSAAAVAIERVAGRRYALVVSDVHMPQMLGTELAVELSRRVPRLPLLLVSARADRRLRAEAAALGVTLLAKPTDRETLLAAVRSLLEGDSNGTPDGERSE